MERIRYVISYGYGQQFRKSSRHRTAKVVAKTDCATFSIKAPTAEEFPLAFTVTRFESRQRGLRSYNDYDGGKSKCGYYKEEIRSIGRKLYRPKRYSHGACLGDKVDDWSYIAVSARRRAADNFHDGYADGKTFGYCDLINIEDVPSEAVWGIDNSASVRKVIRKYLNNVIFFKGVYWEPCEEPRYNYTTFGCCGDGTGFFVTYGVRGRRCTFNALQRAEAIAKASSVAYDRMDYADARRIKRAKERIVVHNAALVTKVR